MKTRASLLSSLLVAVGCGDGLAGGAYRGEALLVVSGPLQVEASERGVDGLQIELIWSVESDVDQRVDQDIRIDGSAGIASYRMAVLIPPPESALNVDPETGGRLGFAGVFVYDDPRKEGPIDLSRVDPSDYPMLLYRLRGGAERALIAYSADRFAEDTRVARTLGGAVEPGFHLVGLDGPCSCPISGSRCGPDPGQDCPNSAMRLIPSDTEVTIRLVNDPSSYQIPLAPDWLFL